MEANNSNPIPVQVDWDEIEKKVNEQHRRNRKRLFLFLLIVAAVIALLFVARSFRTYTGYRVLSSVDRQDTDATDFLNFGEYYVRYSNDGATCSDVKNNSIWNVSYEMSSPIAEENGKYIAIADQGGKTLEIINRDGRMRTITTDLPIVRIDVAENGSSAVMMEENNVCHLTVYNRSGRKTASGEFHDESGGYPLDLAISADGESLAVSSLDISSGSSSSTISFYNFGSAGRSKENNLVGERKFKGTVIPEITYQNDRLFAFGTDKIVAFTGTADPKEDFSIDLKSSSEISAVAYNEDYFAFLLTDNSKSSGNELNIYHTNGRKVSTTSTDAQYSSMGFMNNKELYLTNGSLGAIYTLRGHCKYHGSSDADIQIMLSTSRFRRYMLIEQGKTEVVRLRGW